MGEFATFKTLSNQHYLKVLVSDVGAKYHEPASLSYFDKQLLEPIQFYKLKTFFDDCVNSAHQNDLPPTINNLSEPVLSNSGKYILLVEDSLANQFVIRAMLEKAHHNIDIANNGAIALEMVTQKQYDIILMDLSMPVMGGMEATEKIRQTRCVNQHTPIIALTASVFEENRKECFKIGMNGFLTKPLNMLNLQAEINKHPVYQRPMFPQQQEKPVTTITAIAETLDIAIFMQLRAEISEQVFPQLLNVFLEEGAQRIERIERAISNEDILSLRNETHSLKSESATFGAIKFSELSTQINLLCHQGKKEAALAAAKKLKELWLELKTVLTSNHW